MNVDPSKRDAARRALALDDASLQAQCEETFFIASGPGGQHRNKTESGVRLTHPATGVTVTATERRSQAQNRGVAIERLRSELQKLTFVPRKRHATRPTKSSQRRRVEAKKRVGQKKASRSGKWD